MSELTTVVTVILALSIASERLVEIIKSFLPRLAMPLDDAKAEARRQRYIHLLAVLSGIATAALAQGQLPLDILPAGADPAQRAWAVLALGLLASGGSGLWNSVLTYVLRVKDIKSAEAKEKRIVAAELAQTAHWSPSAQADREAA